MIKFIVKRRSEAEYNSFLGESLKKYNLMSCDVTPTNEEQSKGYSFAWNLGIEAFIKSGLDNDDIICFAHEDVTILDPNFSQKLEMIFKLKPEIGLVGVTGSIELPENGFWFGKNSERGQWITHNDKQSILMNKGNIGFFDDVVVVHKFFIAIRASLLKEGLRFDECFTNDLYNVDMCLQVLERGFKLSVADIILEHESKREGNVGIDLLISKYKERGYSFPITQDQFKNLNSINGVEVSL